MYTREINNYLSRDEGFGQMKHPFPSGTRQFTRANFIVEIDTENVKKYEQPA